MHFIISQKTGSHLHFVNNKLDGCVLTIIYKKEFADVRRFTKYRVCPAAETNTQ